MKLHKLIVSCMICMMIPGVHAENVLPQARIYINPGHGGWGPNDRPMATINYAQLDTLGFFETNTNLWKGLELNEQLKKAGAGYLKMSRTKNGIVSPGDEHKTVNDEYEYEGQIVTLSVICADVETNNMDYFISIHSNAATEGSSTNYPLILYRGWDDNPGNGLTHARDMSIDAWKYIFPNDITYRSFYSLTQHNARGDIDFTYPNSPDSTTIGDKTYVGYYGVLRHGCDGYLSEGCFHTYQPERHRLLNRDYCRQEGIRYARAIRAWFGDETETKGSIMGTVKDISGPLVHSLYNYQVNSMDAYVPLNNVEVILQDSEGNDLARYTTDGEYNGVYVFDDLEPGIYKLYFDTEGYWEETIEIEVVANETAFLNQRLTPTHMEQPKPDVNPEVEDFEHPVQDGDIAAASWYNFSKAGEAQLNGMDNLTIRRAILRNGKYYILATDTQKAPKLLVVNPETGELIKEMSTEGLQTEGYNGKEFAYILSDIAFTQDNVLIGVNSVVVGKNGNTYQTGNFYVYKWQGNPLHWKMHNRN